MITMYDVAKAAGVSKSTVSNVFSQKRPISKEVRERVLDIAKQLNYKPNYMARSLAIKETGIIGLSLIGEKIKFSQFHLSFMNGVLNECYKQGYRLLVNTLSEEYKHQVSNVASDPVDGEIILAPSKNDSRIREKEANNIPLVVIGKPPEEFEDKLSYVDNNNSQAAAQVAEYLLEMGHENILFLNAPKIRTVSGEREKGYMEALEKIGMKHNQQTILYRSEKLTSIDFGFKTTVKMLTDNPRITAVVTDNDKVALGVYRAAKGMGLSIPNDLSVVAFSDGSMFSPELTPPLTCMRLNGEVLGSESTKLLLEQIKAEHKIMKRIIVPIELEERGSTARVENNT
ncbi:LacI family DNA-binding transcriptional regulator [Evansella sp. AB-rgal1]|uniref:LacI family DNA-binding transcriptional regulator n=1 Tax=Evansella sp. AB-rgal1 TaxID=3242696 RepID=UPI00359E75F9